MLSIVQDLRPGCPGMYSSQRRSISRCGFTRCPTTPSLPTTLKRSMLPAMWRRKYFCILFQNLWPVHPETSAYTICSSTTNCCPYDFLGEKRIIGQIILQLMYHIIKSPILSECIDMEGTFPDFPNQSDCDWCRNLVGFILYVPLQHVFSLDVEVRPRLHFVNKLKKLPAPAEVHTLICDRSSYSCIQRARLKQPPMLAIHADFERIGEQDVLQNCCFK